MKQKKKAIELMKGLGIYKPYIKEFQKEGTLTQFINYVGFYISKESKLQKAIDTFQERCGGLVFAVIHNSFFFGECYTFLYVPKDEEEWEYSVEWEDGHTYAFAYVWNETDEDLSEFGSVELKSFGGGVNRIS